MSPNEPPAAMVLKQIGTIRTPYPEPAGTPLGGSTAEGACATVWIEEPYREALKDLEGFDTVWLVYWFHGSRPGEAVVTPFKDTVPRGLFATRAPSRFNPIGISAVRLLAVYADRIEVEGVDIVDGAPLLDIKPYIPQYDSWPESRTGWFEQAHRSAKVADGRFAKADGE